MTIRIVCHYSSARKLIAKIIEKRWVLPVQPRWFPCQEPPGSPWWFLRMPSPTHHGSVLWPEKLWKRRSTGPCRCTKGLPSFPTMTYDKLGAQACTAIEENRQEVRSCQKFKHRSTATFVGSCATSAACMTAYVGRSSSS